MKQLPPAGAARHIEEYRGAAGVIRVSGHLVACDRLLPPGTATTVRVRGERVSATDGPYVETKEQLGEGIPWSPSEIGSASSAA